MCVGSVAAIHKKITTEKEGGQNDEIYVVLIGL